MVDARRFDNPATAGKALSIASQLRCPQCQNQICWNPIARGGQYHQVYSMVAEGKARSGNHHWMTDRYGDFVLLTRR